MERGVDQLTNDKETRGEGTTFLRQHRMNTMVKSVIQEQPRTNRRADRGCWNDTKRRTTRISREQEKKRFGRNNALNAGRDHGRRTGGMDILCHRRGLGVALRCRGCSGPERTHKQLHLFSVKFKEEDKRVHKKCVQSIFSWTPRGFIGTNGAFLRSSRTGVRCMIGVEQEDGP